MKSMLLLLATLALGACIVVAEDSTHAGPSRARRVVNAQGRNDSLPFSHGVLAGDTFYVAGTLGLDPATGQPPADAREEVRLLIESFRDKLRLVGMDMEDLVSVQVFCPDLELYETFNEVYATYFDRDYPARAFLGSGPLLRGCRFEINGVAVRR